MNLVYAALFGLLVVAQYLEYQSNGNAGIGTGALKGGTKVQSPEVIHKNMLVVTFVRRWNEEECTEASVGGIIIDNHTIFTVAHWEKEKTGGYCKLGQNIKHSINREKSMAYFAATEHHAHPKYDANIHLYNIGWITLTHPLLLSEPNGTTPIFRDFYLPNNAGVIVKVYGFDIEEGGIPTIDLLRYTEFEMIHGELCKNLYDWAEIRFQEKDNDPFFCIPFFGVPMNHGNQARIGIDHGCAVTLKDLRDGKEKLLGIISHYETLKANGQSLFFKVQSVPLNYRWRINTDIPKINGQPAYNVKNYTLEEKQRESTGYHVLKWVIRINNATTLAPTTLIPTWQFWNCPLEVPPKEQKGNLIPEFIYNGKYSRTEV